MVPNASETSEHSYQIMSGWLNYKLFKIVWMQIIFLHHGMLLRSQFSLFRILILDSLEEEWLIRYLPLV